MTDFIRHERARRPVAPLEDATARAIRELEAEHSAYIRTCSHKSEIWKRWEAIVGACALVAAVLVAALLT
jgi:hypothetical protein